jgi:hypothetical protein
MKIARNTLEDKDINTIKKLIEDVRKEIDDITKGSDFDHINNLIIEAFEHLRKDERKKAVEKYREIMQLYTLLTDNLKKTVYSACIELNKRLQCKKKT